MSDYTLASMMVEFLADTTRLDRDMDNSVNRAQRAGSRAGSAFALGYSNPILNAIGGVNSVIAGAQTGINFAVSVSGMESAAELGLFRRQLTAIAHDAQKAEVAFKSLKKIAGDSNFNTEEVFSFGLRQAGKSGDVLDAADKTKNLLDAATAFGVQKNNFQYFEENIGDIQQRGKGKVAVKDYRQFMRAAPLATTMMADALGISTKEADQRLQKATGDEFMSMISAVGDKNKGAAAKAGATDPFKVAGNIKDDSGVAMAPTGDLLNKAITPLMQNVRGLVGEFGQLNDATGGGAGLVGILTLGTAGVLRFGGTAKTAWGITTGLTGALRDLSAAEEAATLSTGRAASAARQKATAEEAEAAANRMGARQMVLPLFGAPGVPLGASGVDGQTVTHAPLGFRDRLRGLGNGIKPMAPYGIAIGMDLLGNGLKGDDKAPLWRRETGTALQDIGVGVGMGAPFGLPGMGIGALLGVVGAGIHIYSDLKAEREKDKTSAADPAKDANTRALEKNTASLDKFNGRANGLGPRGRASINSIEAEHQLALLMTNGR